MFVTMIDNRVFVTLSRRNLRQLDAILEERDARNRCLVRTDQNGASLVVQVERDEDHYQGRGPEPAVVHSA